MYIGRSFPFAQDISGGAHLQRVEAALNRLRPVAKGSDNAKFTDDRAKNTADGSTAIYVVTRSGPSVLIYNLGFQTTRSAPSLQSKLNEGHKLEYRQLVQRFAMDGVK